MTRVIAASGFWPSVEWVYDTVQCKATAVSSNGWLVWISPTMARPACSSPFTALAFSINSLLVRKFSEWVPDVCGCLEVCGCPQRTNKCYKAVCGCLWRFHVDRTEQNRRHFLQKDQRDYRHGVKDLRFTVYGEIDRRFFCPCRIWRPNESLSGGQHSSSRKRRRGRWWMQPPARIRSKIEDGMHALQSPAREKMLVLAEAEGATRASEERTRAHPIWDKFD